MLNLADGNGGIIRYFDTVALLLTETHPTLCAMPSDCPTRRAPLRRHARPGWVRQACDTVHELRGRIQLCNQPQFMCTPPDVASRWKIICRHSLDRSCRDWAPGVANAEFEALLGSLVNQHRTALILATDGSVTSEPPRTGWGAYLRLTLIRRLPTGPLEPARRSGSRDSV